MDRKQFITTCLASALLPTVARAQADYPHKPITMIVPFPAGGAADNAARAAMNGVAGVLGQPGVVDNRPGAGGNIGVTVAARAKGDGYTLMLGQISTIVINPHTYTNLQVDPLKALAPISLISSGPMVLVVHPSIPAKNLKEFIAYAKANPGAVNYASSGAGGTTHVAMELLSERTGIQMTHVPYKGGVPALQDLVSGRVQAMADSLPQLLPYVKEGRLRAIAVTGAQRSEYLPDIMTATESGVSDYVLYGWLGIFAPISTPLELRQRLNTTFNGVIASKPYQDFLRANYSPIVATMSLPEFEAFVRKEYARWGQVVRTANIRLE